VNKVAASLRSGQTGVIGVIIPSAAINFFGSVVHGIETKAYENGFQVLIYQSDELEEKERKGIETFLQARVDGILLSVAKGSRNFDHLQSAKESGTPVVLFDRIVSNAGFDSVTINDFQGAKEATMHLIAQGYRRIAHISGPLHLSICQARLKGYKAALKSAGLPYNPEFVITGDISIESGEKAMQQLMNLAQPPDALFAVEDYTALGALQILKKMQVDVPADFGLIGFANETFGAFISPALSSIDQQNIKMGEEAFLLMKNRIEGKRIRTFTSIQKVLPALPVFRVSSIRTDPEKKERKKSGNKSSIKKTKNVQSKSTAVLQY
jgi:LacI family transcriptional regulator